MAAPHQVQEPVLPGKYVQEPVPLFVKTYPLFLDPLQTGPLSRHNVGNCTTVALEGKLQPAMLAKLNTFSLLGIEATAVEVEVDVSPSGLPKTVLVGLLFAVQ